MPASFKFECRVDPDFAKFCQSGAKEQPGETYRFGNRIECVLKRVCAYSEAAADPERKNFPNSCFASNHQVRVLGFFVSGANQL